MTLKEICSLLDAGVFSGQEGLEHEICYAYGTDLMSDALAGMNDTALLLTGLCTTQVFRTAEMLDVSAIVFVRGKQPGEEMRALAQENHICVLLTEKTMFESCGLLYAAGVRGCGANG